MKNTKTVHVNAKSPALAEAITSILRPRLKDSSFETVSKLNEAVPDDGIINLATLGLPNFVDSSHPTRVYTTQLRWESDPEIRREQWALVNDPNTDPAEIAAELQGVDSVTILPHRVVSRVLKRVDTKIAAATEADPEENPDALLLALSEALDTLRTLVS